jgi:Zn finger protein HypA/HybF involved in hydrogenase expression
MMEDVNKCPFCESTVQENDAGYTCPECSTEFSKVGESAYLINHVGNFSVRELLEEVQHMIGSPQPILNF